MSAIFDGIEIWQDTKVEHPPMTKEQQERWDRIQEHCKKVAQEMVQYSEEFYEEENAGC
jgi:hypothetical protein